MGALLRVAVSLPRAIAQERLDFREAFANHRVGLLKNDDAGRVIRNKALLPFECLHAGVEFKELTRCPPCHSNRLKKNYHNDRKRKRCVKNILHCWRHGKNPNHGSELSRVAAIIEMRITC